MLKNMDISHTHSNQYFNKINYNENVLENIEDFRLDTPMQLINPEWYTHLYIYETDNSGKTKRHNVFMCKICNCGKIFNKTTTLKSHLVQHSGVSNFICNFCHKSFSFKHNLSKHLYKIHNANMEEN